MIELLIVVTILAILAGLVFPHYRNSSDSARSASVLADLQVVRQAISAYELDHKSRVPLLSQMWDNLTGPTDDNGNIIEYKKDGKRKGDKKKHAPGVHGPYLLEAPVNPFTGGSECAADNRADWQYDQASGRIRAIVPADQVAELELGPNDVVAAP